MCSVKSETGSMASKGTMVGCASEMETKHRNNPMNTKSGVNRGRLSMLLLCGNETTRSVSMKCSAHTQKMRSKNKRKYVHMKSMEEHYQHFSTYSRIRSRKKMWTVASHIAQFVQNVIECGDRIKIPIDCRISAVYIRNFLNI